MNDNVTSLADREQKIKDWEIVLWATMDIMTEILNIITASYSTIDQSYYNVIYNLINSWAMVCNHLIDDFKQHPEHDLKTLFTPSEINTLHAIIEYATSQISYNMIDNPWENMTFILHPVEDGWWTSAISQLAETLNIIESQPYS